MASRIVRFGRRPGADGPGEAVRQPFVLVTPQMIQAGVAELREHRLDADLFDLAEQVFRAMASSAPRLP